MPLHLHRTMHETSGRSIANQGSILRSPDTPMTISWRPVSERTAATLPWNHPSDQRPFEASGHLTNPHAGLDTQTA